MQQSLGWRRVRRLANKFGHEPAYVARLCALRLDLADARPRHGQCGLAVVPSRALPQTRHGVVPRELQLIVLQQPGARGGPRRAATLQDGREAEAQPEALEARSRIRLVEQRKVPLDQEVVDAAQRARRQPPRQQLVLAGFNVQLEHDVVGPAQRAVEVRAEVDGRHLHDVSLPFLGLRARIRAPRIPVVREGDGSVPRPCGRTDDLHMAGAGLRVHLGSSREELCDELTLRLDEHEQVRWQGPAWRSILAQGIPHPRRCSTVVGPHVDEDGAPLE